MNGRNGAVIGAGSVVARDVSAYSVVVGAPVKIIKIKFSRETAELLEKADGGNFQQKN